MIRLGGGRRNGGGGHGTRVSLDLNGRTASRLRASGRGARILTCPPGPGKLAGTARQSGANCRRAMAMTRCVSDHRS